jgi:hypothetical protein
MARPAAGSWRAALPLLGRRARSAPAAPDAAPAEADDLSQRLDEIEAAALAVYGRHGLPTRAGEYQRGPRARRWTWLGERLDPEARWSLALAKPPEKGWRYGRLEALGGHEDEPELRQASRLLAACARLRQRLAQGGADELIGDLSLAMALGEDWRALRESQARANASRLVLTPPKRRR